MNGRLPGSYHRVASAAWLMLLSACLCSCDRPPKDRAQGYVEGEYVYVASPIAGHLQTLAVQRGDKVTAGQRLFELDSRFETAARDEAAGHVAEAQANVEDAKKGKRPSEIQSTKAQLAQAEAALEFAESEFTRVEGLMKSGAVSKTTYDEDRANRDQAVKRVTQLKADLETAELGQRPDQIAAAEQELKAKQAALAQAEWNLSQKHQDAPKPGIVFDTLYRQGEWVEAGHPVVALLPPENVKVRAFIGESRIAAIHAGDSFQVSVDGVAMSFVGKVSFISPQAEYTPPVIYSQESRDKLVFMIELVFDAETGAKLHPGQPVDVLLGANSGAAR